MNVKSDLICAHAHDAHACTGENAWGVVLAAFGMEGGLVEVGRGRELALERGAGGTLKCCDNSNNDEW